MPKTKPAPEPGTAPKLRALVDEYGALTEKLKPFRADFNRQEAVGKLLRAAAADLAPAKTLTLTGQAFEVQLGAASLRTVIASPSVVLKKIGQKLFCKVASVTLTALKENVHPLLVAELTHQEPIGPRAIELHARETLAKAA
jgi:hypothetical protein